MTDPMLKISGLTKHFGAVRASDGLNLCVEAGAIHALIGPNGAGKSTAISQLSGETTADSGEIWFDGQNITRWPAHRRARAGIARSYQITQLFREMTVLENVALAVQAKASHHFRFLRSAAADPSLNTPARATLARLDLEALAPIRVSELAHGQQRQVELAMALAVSPQLVLLDEPMAGMSHVESQRMAEQLEQLRGQVTILLVEHDMDVVFRLADRISVLVKGQVLCTDRPERIREDPQVQAAYLGDAR